MDQGTKTKIRTLPRPEKAESAAGHPVEHENHESPWMSPRLLVNLGIVACCAVMAFMFMSKSPKQQFKAAKKAAIQSQDLTSVKAPGTPNDIVAKYLQESQLKTEMIKRARQLENMNSRGDASDSGAVDYDPKNYGVQMDQEDTASKVFDDLHDNDAIPPELLPGDRINARLAKNKWTNELERNERITFVREFIKSAYAKGYEVQLDQNLVVVGVKKITNQKVNIDQVLSKLAKQGM